MDITFASYEISATGKANVGGRFVSSDHVVGEIEKAPGNGKVDPLGGSDIDYEFKFGRCLNRHIGRLFALEDAINVARRATKLVDRIGGHRRSNHRQPRSIG